jgi:hypothetical protein
MVGRYLRSLVAEESVNVREITATVMDILTQDANNSTPSTPVKLRSTAQSRQEASSRSGSVVSARADHQDNESNGLGQWESISDATAMQRSVSSQTTNNSAPVPVPAPRAKTTADGATGTDDSALIEEVAEQVGNVLKSALQDALIKSYTSQVSSSNPEVEAPMGTSDEHGDVSDYESVASRGQVST